MSIAEKALLAKVQFGTWGGFKVDKSRSEELVRRSRAMGGLKVVKQYMPKLALSAINSHASAAKREFEAISAPWEESGFRILPASLYDRAMSGFEANRSLYNSKVNVLIEDYEGWIDSARGWMGDAFNRDDYPSKDQVRGFYGSSFKARTISVAGDFRADIGDEEQRRIRAHLQSDLDKRLLTVTKDVMGRIYESLHKMHRQLEKMVGGDKATYRDALTNNLREVVDLAEALNVTGNKELEALRVELRESLVYTSPGTEVRADATKRHQQKAQANAILAKMRGFLGDDACAELEKKAA